MAHNIGNSSIITRNCFLYWKWLCLQHSKIPRHTGILCQGMESWSLRSKAKYWWQRSWKYFYIDYIYLHCVNFLGSDRDVSLDVLALNVPDMDLKIDQLLLLSCFQLSAVLYDTGSFLDLDFQTYGDVNYFPLWIVVIVELQSQNIPIGWELSCCLWNIGWLELS